MERAGYRSVSAIYRVDDSTGLARPLFECTLSAGFPSPADGYTEDRIDLNRDMILHPDATYYARISGDSMIGEGLWDGSLVAFDRALTALDGDIVVACIDNSDFCCKIYRDGHDDHGRIRLEAANPLYAPIRPSVGTELHIVGLVTFSVHWHAKRYGRRFRVNRLQ
jgi:DNA polymerase V